MNKGSDVPLANSPAIAPVLRPVLLGLTGLGVAAAGISPLSLPVMLLLLTLAVVLNEIITGRLGVPAGWVWRPVPYGAALCCWALVTALWTTNPADAVYLPLACALGLGAAISLISWFALLPSSDRQQFLLPIVAGACFGLTYLAIEHFVSGGIIEFAAPWLKSAGLPQTVDVRFTHAARTAIYFNRHAAAIVLFLPIVALALAKCDRLAGLRTGLYGGLGVLVLAILMATQSATAVLAFAAAAVMVGIYAASRQWAWRVLLTGWVVALLLALPLASGIYASGSAQWQRLPESFRERVLIWEWYRMEALSRPPVGIGMMGSKVLFRQWAASASKADLVKSEPRPGRHPHNGYLELWFELGVPGALLALVFGFELLRSAQRFDRQSEPYLLAFGAAVMAIMATGWSIWQPWLIGAFAWGTVLAAWVAMSARNERPG